MCCVSSLFCFSSNKQKMDKWLLKSVEGEGTSLSHDFDSLNSSEEQCEEEMIQNIELPSSSSLSLKKKRNFNAFREEWRQKYPWLKAESTKQGKKCVVCNTPIVGGKTHIQRHSSSDLHKRTLESANKSLKLDTLLQTNKESMRIAEKAKRLEISLSCFVAEHNLPFACLDHLNLLLKSNISDSNTVQKMLINRQKGQNIIKNILGPKNSSNISLITNRQYYSILIDESTDSTTKKNLAVIVRVFDKECRDMFLTLKEITDCSASGIFEVLTKILKENNIPLKNLIGFTADNCSVMMGRKNGVQAKLKEIAPRLVVNGCVCHKLNLASKVAAAQLPDSIDKLIRDINHHFCNSSVRKEDFVKFQEYFGTGVHTILKYSTTRWLSRQAAIDRIIEQWDSLTYYFGLDDFDADFGNENINFISRTLSSELMKLYFLFLSYVLKMINDINLEMQSEEVRVHVLLPRMRYLIKQLCRNFIKKNVLDATDIISLDLKLNHLPLQDVYCGTASELFCASHNINQNEIFEFKLNAKNFYIGFCEDLLKRIDFRDECLNYITKFSPNAVISGEMNSITNLILHFFPEEEKLQIDVINNEFRALADFEHIKQFKNKSISAFWTEISFLKNENNEYIFRNIYRIAQGLLSIPHSSACVERIFSFQNIIKTKCRNRLQIETCSSLIQTKNLLRNVSCHNFTISKDLIEQNLQNADLLEDELLD